MTMINYTHDGAWLADLDLCINTTTSSLKAFGIGQFKEIPTVIAAELRDKGSVFYRFVEVFFDEVRFNAEVSFSAETEGNRALAYDDHARKKAVKTANLERFNGILDDTLLFCILSKDYGDEFTSAVRSVLIDSFAHQGFLFELYETIMLKTRWSLLEGRPQ